MVVSVFDIFQSVAANVTIIRDKYVILTEIFRHNETNSTKTVTIHYHLDNYPHCLGMRLTPMALGGGMCMGHDLPCDLPWRA